MLARVSVLLGKINPALGELWGIQLCIFFLVVALTVIFIIGYVIQGTRVGVQLWNATRRLQALTMSGKSIERTAVAAVLIDKPFDHLWQEYSHTLYAIEAAAGPSATRIEVRATVPSEMYFTRDALVDSRLFDDFTRHLPGVLTGLGIIGTFAGLLEGLSRFDASSSVTAVAGLKHLLDGVAHAFTTSAIAIGCAMLVVFVSRFALAIFYKQLELLNQTIDGMYAAGAGEEYLARLLQRSEQSDAQAAATKQELVTELARLLNGISDRQIQANALNTQALGRYFGDALKSSLEQKPRSGGIELPPAAGKKVPESQSHDIDTVLTELRGPVDQLRVATAQLAGAVQEIHSALARLHKH